jgi:hypothetical protein
MRKRMRAVRKNMRVANITVAPMYGMNSEGRPDGVYRTLKRAVSRRRTGESMFVILDQGLLRGDRETKSCIARGAMGVL